MKEGENISHARRERLDVRIEKQDSSKYKVTVSWRGMHEASEYIPPYSPEELKNILKVASALDDNGRPVASASQLGNIGLKLYNSLFPIEEIRNIVSQCIARGEGAADLHLIYKDLQIGNIPWELLNDGTAPLIASGVFNLIRVVDIHAPFKDVRIRSPLKILVAMARPLDQHLLEKAPPNRHDKRRVTKRHRRGRYRSSLLDAAYS